MKQKVLTLVISMMFLFSVLPMVMATNVDENLGEVVSAGQVIESSFVTERDELSSEFGGIASILEEIITQTVMFGSTTVWDSQVTTGYSDFSVFIFESGLSPNFENIIDEGDLFETSNTCEILGVTGQWATYNIESVIDSGGGDYVETPFLIGDRITFIDGSWVEITSLSVGTYGLEYTTEATPTGSALLEECSVAPWRCPLPSQLDILKQQFEIGTIDLMAYHDGGFLNGVDYSQIFIMQVDSNPEWLIFANLDLSPLDDGQQHSFDFTAPTIISGKKVSTQNGVSLLLSEPGTFDVYAVI